MRGRGPISFFMCKKGMLSFGAQLCSCLVTVSHCAQRVSVCSEGRVAVSGGRGSQVQVLLCPGSLCACASLGCCFLICAMETSITSPLRTGALGKLSPTQGTSADAHWTAAPCSVLPKQGPVWPCLDLSSSYLPSVQSFWIECWKRFTKDLPFIWTSS